MTRQDKPAIPVEDKATDIQTATATAQATEAVASEAKAKRKLTDKQKIAKARQQADKARAIVDKARHEQKLLKDERYLMLLCLIDNLQNSLVKAKENMDNCDKLSANHTIARATFLTVKSELMAARYHKNNVLNAYKKLDKKADTINNELSETNLVKLSISSRYNNLVF